MFKLLLISKYLRRRLAPLFAGLAVMLCTAMVLIVISVMGGFLETLRSSIQNMAPQVKVVEWGMTGIEDYQVICNRLEELPEVAAATPVIQTLGLMEVRGARNDVIVVGVDPQRMDRVVKFRDSLMWTTQAFVDHAQARAQDPTLSDSARAAAVQRAQMYAALDLEAAGMTMRPDPFFYRSEDAAQLSGAVTGVATIPYNRRDEDGIYRLDEHAMGWEFTLTVVPLTQSGGLQDPAIRKFVIANEFKSGHYEFDSSLIFVPFDVLQKMLRMEAFEAVETDPETGEDIGEAVMVPGRASEIFVAGHDDIPLDVLRTAVDRVIHEYSATHRRTQLISITWEEDNQVILGAVQNEKGMVTFLFIIISIVAVWMVWLTFNTFVVQKVRDIGVLRALGASSTGVLSIFLGYGLTVGLLGALIGFAVAATVVYGLNELQYFLKTFLGEATIYAGATLTGITLAAMVAWLVLGRRRLGLAGLLGAAATGGIAFVTAAIAVLHFMPDWAAGANQALSWQMWDPRIYAFDQIPEHIDLIEAGFIVGGFVLASVIGALIPSIIAANVDPVETLRYE